MNPLTPRAFRLLTATLVAGLLAGLAALYAVALSHALIYLLFGGEHGLQLSTMQAVPHLELLLVLTVSGLLAGICWWWLLRKPLVELKDSLEHADASYSIRRTLLDASAQVALVSVGTSMGREKAPREIAAALMNRAATPFHLTPEDRALVLASAAGAGLAAVYNAPLSGAAYALCTIIAMRRWFYLPLALLTSFLATLTVNLLVPAHALPRFSAPVLSPWTLLLALALALICGLAGYGFHHLGKVAQSGRLPRRFYPVSLTLALVGTALLGRGYPELLGNGIFMLQELLTASLPLVTLLVLTLIKPALTLLTLGSGARGGVLAPALAFGAGIGALLALALGVPDQSTVLALIGAAALLAASEKTGIFAGIFTAEIVGASFEMTCLIMATALGSAALSRALARRA